VADVLERRCGDLLVRIDRLLCVGFGDCIGEAPEAFQLDEGGVADFGAAPDAVERERLIRACEACPVDALSVVQLDGTPVADGGAAAPA
jgi:ferredoxin